MKSKSNLNNDKDVLNRTATEMIVNEFISIREELGIKKHSFHAELNKTSNSSNTKEEEEQLYVDDIYIKNQFKRVRDEMGIIEFKIAANSA